LLKEYFLIKKCRFAQREPSSRGGTEMTRGRLINHKVPSFLKIVMHLGKLAVLTFFLFAIVAVSCGSVHAETDWTTLFWDDFEDGNAYDWQLDAGWVVEPEGSNYVLSGSGGSIATLSTGYDWTDYRFQIKVKLTHGDAVALLNYRASMNGRYFLSFEPGGLVLRKESPPGTFIDLGGFPTDHFEDTWYTIEIEGVQGSIKIYENGDLMLEYNDDAPLLHGRISLEVPNSSHVHFDDVMVVGALPPAPPLGYIWRKTGGPSGGLGYDVALTPQTKTSCSSPITPAE
jgi:hypothetical protein